MQVKKILLLYGGLGSESEVSISSAEIFSKILKDHPGYDLIEYKLHDRLDVKLLLEIDFVIPCMHGYPGESGDIQSVLELLQISYLGTGAEGSRKCFDKISTKLWLDKIGVKNTSFKILTSMAEYSVAEELFHEWGGVFIKPHAGGSSFGCFCVEDLSSLKEKIRLAFQYSSYVLVEKIIRGRELEIAVFEYRGEIHVTQPSEILKGSNKLYDFNEKYGLHSETRTEICPNLGDVIEGGVKERALLIFLKFQLKDLARIDFFYTSEGELILNEINTFPGMTRSSLFPKMMETYGVSFKNYLIDRIEYYN